VTTGQALLPTSTRAPPLRGSIRALAGQPTAVHSWASHLVSQGFSEDEVSSEWSVSTGSRSLEVRVFLRSGLGSGLGISMRTKGRVGFGLGISIGL
jgi:hypothetical protein